MNNDRISNTPGGERMLLGGIVLGFAYVAWHGLRYELGIIGNVFFGALAAYGAVQLFRGIVAWKYIDRETFEAAREKEHLLIDVPLINGNRDALNAIEDALVALIESSRNIEIEMQSIDWANEMGTIHLRGKSADALYAHVFSTLARFAGPTGLVLFPNPGMPIDTEIHGKRLMVGLPGRKVE
ncbi:MAG: hypothetical protein QNJ29_03390 [Rhizobiaceae bacterium]|nr:hypothetical protein [Rhizobiaceae bacterium]